MTKGQFLEKISHIRDDQELKLYVFDCEYDDEGYELGSAKVMSVDGNYVYLRIH